MKMLLEKDRIYFPLIYVGHKNEHVVKKDTNQFLLISVGHKMNTVKKRHNTISVDLC